MLGETGPAGDTIEATRGTCPVCGLGCLVEAKIVNNRPISIRPDHASGFPADCPRAGQARDYHDHPERVNYPMKRAGKRGEGKWERISWDQALSEIAAKLASIRDNYGPEAVQTIGGSYKGAGDASCWRWSNLWGSPNLLHQGKNCGEAEQLAEWAVYGDHASLGYGMDPAITKCYVLWGVNETHSTVAGKKKLRALQANGGRIIVIDPYRTELAQMADLWLQIRPGADGALAYGMLNIIISEKLYDARFVEQWCTGFAELTEAVRSFTPERVSEITWIPAAKIIEAARMFATHKPGLIPFGLGVVELGKATASAVFGRAYLRAITGNLDVAGGAKFGELPKAIQFIAEMHWDKLLNHPLRTRDTVSCDTWPIASVKAMKLYREAMAKVHPTGIGPQQYSLFVAPSSLWTAVIEQRPYPIKAMVCQGGNPLVSLGDARRAYEAFSSDNLELSVNMDHWMTPCGQLADYVLPATDALERPQIGNMWGFGDTFVVAKRLVEPLYERRDDYQLWRELGDRLGQEGYWHDTLEQWFDKLLEPSNISFMEATDLEIPFVVGDRIYKRYETTGFATASGKVELASPLMASLGYPAIPSYEEPAWSPVGSPELFQDYPLVMTTGSSLKWFYRSQQRHLAKMRKQHPYAQLSIHPDTAAALGIEEGSTVWVETPLGRVRQIAKFSDGWDPRVVHADSHMWYPERQSEGDNLFGLWESNINAILPDGAEYSDYAGDNYLRGLICKVYPAETETVSRHDAQGQVFA